MLIKVERRWSTIVKEASAVFYGLRKWDEYFRDTKFTMQPDHKNLKYVNAEPKAIIQRWKLAIQSFDFWLKHIAGESNVVADEFSRFCENEILTDETIIVEHYYAKQNSAKRGKFPQSIEIALIDSYGESSKSNS